jgi:hypothetical protein
MAKRNKRKGLWTKQKLRALLEERFPGHAQRDVFRLGPFAAWVVDERHEVSRHTCFGYGGEIGTDVSHTFGATLLLPPLGRAENPGFVVFRLSGYSSSSTRYDQDAVTLEAELFEGQTIKVSDEHYYQKYGGRSRDERGDLDPLERYVRDRIGLPQASPKHLADFLRKLRRSFSY